MNENKEIAVFGGGCFWCTEAIFQSLRGVSEVVSGYAGGDMDYPSYEAVSTGSTGHAEVVKIEFDPEQINFLDLLEVFFETHDPTTLNRQGNDIGSQYRSVIFYTTEEQKTKAEDYIKQLFSSGKFSSPIVTEVLPLGEFFEAEEYHKNYYIENESKPYCQLVISPKLKKLREKFAPLLKEDEKNR